MSLSPLLTIKKPEFQKVIDYFRQELGSLRGGRANPVLIESVVVDAYGSPMPIKGVASVRVPDAKTLAIELWDASLIKEVERALIEANLGMMPTVQGKIIRLIVPPMTEERRRELTKIVKDKAEDARRGIRSVREKIREGVLQMEHDKEISEDDRFRMQDELDKMTKQFTDEIEKIIEEKEKEIMTV